MSTERASLAGSGKLPEGCLGSALDSRDEGSDHLSSLVLIRPADDARQVGLSDLRFLGALVEGWDEEHVRARLGVSDPATYPRGLARRLGSGRGLYLPRALWP